MLDSYQNFEKLGYMRIFDSDLLTPLATYRNDGQGSPCLALSPGLHRLPGAAFLLHHPLQNGPGEGQQLRGRPTFS